MPKSKKNFVNSSTSTSRSQSVSSEDLDKLIHEPKRLQIMALLYAVDSADMVFLKQQYNFTWGNLATHVSKLEEARYIEVSKEFVEKKPRTTLKITPMGQNAFKSYRENMNSLLSGK